MNQVSLSYLEHAMYEHQQALLEEAQMRAMANEALRAEPRREPFRTMAAQVGRRLVSFGSRLEALERTCDKARMPSPAR